MYMYYIIKSVCQEVVESLEMSEYAFVSVSPDQPNIYYEVRMHTEIETDFADLCLCFDWTWVLLLK